MFSQVGRAPSVGKPRSEPGGELLVTASMRMTENVAAD
jgi:hypothetical protein